MTLRLYKGLFKGFKEPIFNLRELILEEKRLEELRLEETKLENDVRPITEPPLLTLNNSGHFL